MCYIIVTGRSLIWVLVSLVALLLMFSALVSPKWILAEPKETTIGNNTFTYTASLGVYTRCKLTKEDFYCSTIAVRGLATDSSVFPIAWKTAMVFISLGLTVMALTVLSGIMSFCFQSIFKKSIFTLSGATQAFAGMPSSCCVPLCTSNYENNERITIFHFPKNDERKIKWLRAIHRKNFVPNKSTVICVRHFDEKYIIREDKIVKPDGAVLVFPRSRIKLTEDAYPTIFEKQPKYLNTEVAPARKDPQVRKLEIDRKKAEKRQKSIEKDTIQNFEDLRTCHATKTKDFVNFKVWVEIDKICFVKLDFDGEIPRIASSLVIKENLSVTALKSNFIVNECSTVRSILNANNTCNTWTCLQKLLSFLDVSYAALDLENNVVAAEENVKRACNFIDTSCNLLHESQSDESGVMIGKLKFAKDQLLLVFTKRIRYSVDTLLWSSSIYFAFAGGYKKIRDSNMLTLPTPRYLNSLKMKLGTDSPGINDSHKCYLAEKLKHLPENDKFVTVMLDEIHNKPKITYKGGKLKGYNVDPEGNPKGEIATTVQTFMLQSILSKNKDVVGLYPAKNLNGGQLHELTLIVIEALSKAGYVIVALVSDNHKTNRKMFNLLSGGTMTSSIINPYDANCKIFLLFDTVHIFKSIRNNWMNQKDSCQTFVFPPFEPDQVASCSSSNDHSKLFGKISDLRNLHASEEANTIKLAPALSKKVLHPVGIERQNVSLCTKLFDEKNIAALKILEPIKANGTIQFLEILSKWWKIVNVQSKFKGANLRDPFQNPIFSLDDDNINFLQSVSDWLSKWNDLSIQGCDGKGRNQRHGKLTEETQFSLSHTTKSLVLLSEYILKVLKFEYVLLGKFQSDPLEARFGQYRQMSGCSYHVTLTQILESEQKIKLLNLIKLTSSVTGTFSLQEFLNTAEVEASKNADISATLDKLNLDCIFSYTIELTENDLMVLIYIGGFIAHKVKKKCKSCYAIMSVEKTIVLECSAAINNYIKLLDRGGLNHATEYFNQVILSTYCLFQALISERFENIFLQCSSHKQLLSSLSLKKLEYLQYELGDEEKCSCGTSVLSLVKKTIATFSNILLNNYSKVENNNIKEKSFDGASTSKKRKLQKFSHQVA